MSGRGGIGIFGGSFNPIHVGHLRAAEEMREGLGLDEVWLVPAAAPPHKPLAELARAEHRLRMTELAVADLPGFRVSRIELDRDGPSYSIDTLRTVRRELGPEHRLVFGIGYDAFRELQTWKDHAAIFTVSDVAVVTRPPWPAELTREEIPFTARGAFWYDPESASYRHSSGHVLSLLPITALDVSAATIRAHVASRRSIRFLVPAAVEAYIGAHDLYRCGDDAR